MGKPSARSVRNSLFSGARYKRRLRPLVVWATGRSLDGYPDENSFRRLSAYILSSVMFTLLLCAIVLDLYEGNYRLIPALVILAAICPANWVWLRCDAKVVFGPLWLLNASLMCLGIFLLLCGGASSGSSLFWFIIFPPMVMISMGLRHGTIGFCIFYAFLILLLLTPLSVFLAEPLSSAVKMRFLFSMLGAFVFSLSAEYVRTSTFNALSRALLLLEREALSDHLTGLGNRRDFQNYFSWICARSMRDNQPFSLALIDLDHFKNVNDTYGHNVGDQVLRHLAGLFVNCIRATDRVFRWGGEEFIVLMPDTPIVEARSLAERIRLVCEVTPYSADEREIPVTISIGLRECDAECGQQDQVVEADRNLYLAKASGRNCVIG